MIAVGMDLASTRPIGVGDRVRFLSAREVGLVIAMVDESGCARVAFEGRLPVELPVGALVRVEGRCAA